ncbi:MAG: hypothetical protein ACRBG0_25000 [Lewinella sp.]|uniref:hypothetical protein n=1 Tax=Lewinella sp. TaxID=2004506 RepID=UPI003D6A2A48
MKKIFKWLLVITIFWGLLTLFTERAGPAYRFNFGLPTATQKALIVYSPDPIYNLDEQVCIAMAKKLNQYNWRVEVSTVAAVDTTTNYDLYVLCANTYNWSPDWAITRFAKTHNLSDKNVAALTLGSGSTTRAQHRFEMILHDQKIKLLDSRSLWLLRPNDEARIEEKNVDVAKDMAAEWVEVLLDGIDN